MPASLTSVDEELALGGEREPAGEIAALLDQLEAIRAEMLAAPTAPQSRLEKVHPQYRDSARNLLHYLALRRHDLRSLQPRLAALGLSSLGRAEPHALATVEAVLAALHRLAGGAPATAGSAEAVGFGAGERLLATHSEALLGPPTAGREVRIMVTMPSEAGEDYALVHGLLRQGMDCMRINCAHDDATTWLRMIEHLRRAERALGRSCRVVMDLGGPKLRTGPLEPGPQVVRVRPRRDAFGQVVAPARIWLTPASAPAPSPSPADACLPMPAEWLARLRPGRRISLEDSRDARRLWTVVEAADGGCWAEAVRTAYVVSGTVLRLEPEAGEKRPVVARVGTLPASEAAVPLRQGDLLVVTGDLEPGRAATHDSAGQLLSPARIGCTIPEVLADVRSGDAIWFDDGKIGGLVRKAEPARLQVEITRARLRGEKLRADKGINLPDSPLRLGALTAKDLEDLPFVAAHADVVELSFANSAADLEELQENLARLGSRQPAIVVKIETRRGFESLPDMLLTAMRSPRCGVMIARGDLAVESGFERLAEMQEEILWLCEAAHVPVIWATQVLESLAKEGLPSRAEITDAAMGHRAECVMLNKGPHMLAAVRVLDDILRRMQSHQTKKRAMLRELRLAHAVGA